MTNYLTQDAPLSPPDTSRAEEEESRYDKFFRQWVQDAIDDREYNEYCQDFCDKNYAAFMEYLSPICRRYYDRMGADWCEDYFVPR